MNTKGSKWSRKYDSCESCGTSKVKYMGKGLCQICYLKAYRENPANLERISLSKKKYYANNVTPERTRKIREAKYFNNNRAAVLERDNFSCTECGSADSLVVHHIDRTGRGVKGGHNNDVSNLKTLCRSCHIEEHRKELLDARTKG